MVSVGWQAEPLAQQRRVDRRLAGIGIPHRWMLEQIGEREPVSIAARLESGVQLFAQRRVERPVDEVVRFFHADLAARLSEVACFRRRGRGRRAWSAATPSSPRRAFGRPSTPRERASADGEDQPAVVEGRMIHPRHAQIGSTTQERHVLHMLWQYERPGLEHEDPPAARGVRDEECSATTAPKVPPPMTITSKSRRRPATVCAALSSASCNVLQRNRPMLSSVKDVDSDVKGGAMM